MLPESGFRIARDWSQIGKMIMMSQFSDKMLLLSSLVAGPSFMSISPFVLELKQFHFVKD